MFKKNSIKKGVIIAAGLGTRFLPATKAVPKEMLPIGDKPVIQHIVEEMASSGITEIMIVISHGKEAIEHHFERDTELEAALMAKGKLDRLQSLILLSEKVRFYYTRQAKPLGNGHALLCARDFVGDDAFAFSDGDSVIDASVPVMRQLIDVFLKKNSSVIGVQRIDNRQTMTKYGNVYAKPASLSRLYRVEKFVEKPNVEHVSPEGLIVGGMRYVLTKDIWSALESQAVGRDGEIWMADAANQLAQQKPFYAYEYEGRYFDTGDPEALLRAAVHFGQQKEK